MEVPGRFPDDYLPVQGMAVRGCIEYYKEAMGQEWDVDDVTGVLLWGCVEGRGRRHRCVALGLWCACWLVRYVLAIER